MGFYHGTNRPQKDPDETPSLREALVITWVVFTVLAKPLAVLLGGVAYLVLIFVLFGIHPIAGGVALSLPLVALAARGIWEWRNPPELP